MLFVGNLSAQTLEKTQRPEKSKRLKHPKECLECLDSINTLNAKIDTLTQQIADLTRDLQLEKEGSKIDKFLNIQDTTIFNSNYQDISPDKIYPRSKEIYQWVKNVHYLDSLLIAIEQDDHTISNYNHNLRDLPESTGKELARLSVSVKENITKADDLRYVIERTNDNIKSTDAQKRYYHVLIAKLNKFIDIYFSE
jgi:hypothetical protein